jgi:hypothetical protein
MNKVKVFHINTHQSQIYDSITKAAEATGRPQVSISRVLAGVTKKSGVYWFTKDLSVTEMPILKADKRIIDKVYHSNNKKKIISEKVDKETHVVSIRQVCTVSSSANSPNASGEHCAYLSFLNMR